MLPSSLQASALKSAYFGAAYHSLHPATGDPISHSWISAFVAVNIKETALHAAFTAVALARAGQQTKDLSFSRQSHVAYDKALLRLKSRLVSQLKTSSDETLACIMLLAVFETIHGSSEKLLPGMMAHTKGASEYLQLQGPAAFATAAGRSVVRDLRLNKVLAAVSARSKHFLSDDQWMQLLQQDSPRSVKDDLMDLIGQLPDIMQRFDRSRRAAFRGTARPEMLEIQALYQGFVGRLITWRDAAASSETYSFGPSEMPEDEKNKAIACLSGQVRIYDGVVSAELELIYSTIQAMVHLELISVSTILEEPTGVDSVIDEEEVCTTQGVAHRPEDHGSDLMKTVRAHVDAVVQSIEYCLRPESGVLAANILIYPMMVAVSLMRSWHDPRVEYVMALVKRYQQQTGVRLADLLMEGINWGE